MKRELKARIQNVAEVETGLIKLGAWFVREATYYYTYFTQSAGKVLKLTESSGKVYQTIIKKRGEQFEIVANDLVENPEVLERQLTKTYGVKKKLTNKRRFFALDDSEVSTNEIAGVGDFLIIEAVDPPQEILNKLGIPQAAIITDSFDNL